MGLPCPHTFHNELNIYIFYLKIFEKPPTEIFRRFRGSLFIVQFPHVSACASRMVRGSPLTSLSGGFINGQIWT